MSDMTAPRVLGAPAPRAVAYEAVTIGYNLAEGVVAVAAGRVAGSVALTDMLIDVAKLALTVLAASSPPGPPAPAGPTRRRSSVLRAQAGQRPAVTSQAVASITTPSGPA